MTKKYELLESDTVKSWDGRTLFRIRALVAIGLTVVPGQLGGYIEGENNLSQISGDAWIFGDAWIYGNAQISGDAKISGDAQIYGNAKIYGDAKISGDAQIYGNAKIYGDAQISGDAQIYGDAKIYGDAQIYGDAYFGWFSKVGSENGTLTWFATKDGNVYVNRGCFNGSLAEFSAAVEKRHGDSQCGQEYRLLIQFIELRSGKFRKV